MDYAAQELLHKILEFLRMTPERAEWSFEVQRENPPRLVRLRQIDALFSAFGCAGAGLSDVGARIEAFSAGRFVPQRRLEDYAGLLAEIEATIGRSKRPPAKCPIRLDDLRVQFADLLQLRLKLDAVVEHHAGLLEVGYSHYYSFVVTNGVSGLLSERIEELDRVLTRFIDPAGRSFSEEDLRARFGFPSENLNDIDFDWL